jgi:phosphoribosylaminoimidazole-succinocarboxamide synthase
MPKGLLESEKLERPIFTPSTKAEQGQHDENIHPDKRNLPPQKTLQITKLVKELIGEEKATKIEQLAIQLYSKVLITLFLIADSGI